MAKFKQGVTLYREDAQLGVIQTKPGIESEYHQRLLEGWSEKRPSGKKPAAENRSAGSADKKA